MLVECSDKTGGEVYEMIIRQIFQDLQLSPSVKDMRVFVDPAEVVFIIVMQMDRTAPNVMLSEVATYKYDKNSNETTISLKEEKYLPILLKKLWIIKGRENVHQPNRFQIVITGEDNNLSEIAVDDHSENLKKRLYDAAFRIIPEGFRIIKDLSKDNLVALVCTDELIKDEWVEKAESFIKELETN
ncbi:MAG: methanogenesis marker 17 protein [Methanobacteriaceae archaeon]